MLKKLFPITLLLLSGPSNPPAAPTIGFFMDSWQPRTFVVPASTSTATTAAPGAGTATVTIDADSVITRIPPSVFGHNANTWMGTMINQPTLITNLTNLNPHVIRWPAGSGSDEYFWDRGPGQWPPDVPDLLPDANGKKKALHLFYGRPKGNGQASLDDYYALLKATGNEGLITVNYGYARYGTSDHPVAMAAHLAADWVRYDHGRTRYWELGNENFGFWENGYRIDTATNKDGQPLILSGDLYGRHFLVFADSMRKAAAEVGATIYIGAVTFDAQSQPWDLPIVRNWNTTMMKAIHDQADYYVVHSYFTPYNQNTSAAGNLHDATTVPARMMDYVQQCLRESGAAVKPVAMDEWNMFAVGSKQQVSNISGLFGVIVLGEALRSKYGLATRWDLLNGWGGGNDHGLFSAGDEPGVARWSPRPSFYYLYYLQRMMGDRLLEAHIQGDTSLRAYASSFSSGELGTALVNTATTPVTVTIGTRHFKPGARFYWYSLRGGDDNGDFSAKVFVNGQGPASPSGGGATASSPTSPANGASPATGPVPASAGGPADYATMKANAAPTAGGIRVTVPARGAVFLVIGK